MPDSLSVWMGRYLELAVVGVRSQTVAEKAAPAPSFVIAKPTAMNRYIALNR